MPKSCAALDGSNRVGIQSAVKLARRPCSDELRAGEEAEAERLLRAFRTVATPAKDTVRRQEFAELRGISPAGVPEVSFRCIAAVYRNEFSDEVMDITLDRLSQAALETVLGISHYMHGEV